MGVPGGAGVVATGGPRTLFDRAVWLVNNHMMLVRMVAAVRQEKNGRLRAT
ncbi:hypothetical protein [Streptomyces sp. YU58]|uniref:hypothetical protein n=1 Tax=Streptomyces sp. SX92 TaxID=3158972 RepID=UPI0027BAB948|nr:hypothetical protein [Streptomyces coralus]WLW56965.1 hypothetical protein QU709_38850 [Streptomyces coralus]